MTVETGRESLRCRRRALHLAIAFLAFLATTSLPVHAQRVTLLNFTDQSAGEPLDLSGIEDAVPEEDLARDFNLLGRSSETPAAPAIAATVVPAWMRSGTVPPVHASSAAIGASGVCAALPYRPRRDLPLATEARRARFFPMVAQAACEAGLPVGLFDALIVQESRYNQSAVSPKGAIGLSQLMPGTARYLSILNPYDALSNLRGGARYLREQLTAFGRVDLALAAYNAGPGRVRKRWAVPRISETQGYVSSVTRGWHMGVAREAALLNFQAEPPPPASATPIGAQGTRIFLFAGRP